MRKQILILAFFVTSIGFSQVGERISIDGRISVPSGDDPEGIIVTNLTSNSISVSDGNGHFGVAVALGDRINFSALQFEDFSIVVDQKVLNAKKLNVFINAQTTELPEVVVRPFDLSGNVEVDVNRIPVEGVDLPEISSREVYDPSLNFRPDSLDSPENAAMRNSLMKNGLNFANIFRAIYTSEEFVERDYDSLTEEIRQLYDDDFFLSHLQIERDQIHNFILYAEDNGLTKEMLEKGNEFELIEFLIEQGREYNVTQVSD